VNKAFNKIDDGDMKRINKLSYFV